MAEGFRRGFYFCLSSSLPNLFPLHPSCALSVGGSCVRKRTRRFKFCAVAANKNYSLTFHRRRNRTRCSLRVGLISTAIRSVFLSNTENVLLHAQSHGPWPISELSTIDHTQRILDRHTGRAGMSYQTRHTALQANLSSNAAPVGKNAINCQGEVN